LHDRSCQGTHGSARPDEPLRLAEVRT
jgi:hypothetical protein